MEPWSWNIGGKRMTDNGERQPVGDWIELGLALLFVSPLIALAYPLTVTAAVFAGLFVALAVVKPEVLVGYYNQVVAQVGNLSVDIGQIPWEEVAFFSLWALTTLVILGIVGYWRMMSSEIDKAFSDLEDLDD